MTSAVPAPWRVVELRTSVALPTVLALVAAISFVREVHAAPEAVAPEAADAPAEPAAEPEAEQPAEQPAEPEPAEVVDEPAADEPDEDPDEPALDEEAPEEDASKQPVPEGDPPEPEPPIRPPRFDGPYVGVVAFGTANFASVLDLDTSSPLIGTTGFLQAGDAVFPWMSIGVAAGGGAAWAGNQQMFVGALLVEFGFVPMNRHPLSIRAGFGFGGGAVREPDLPRAGFGGALFKGSFRYEFFPLAERKRANRGGGWAIGPELGWLGATPAGPGQPFVNTVLLGLSTSFYFGS